jgi:hypothetical protein
MMPLKLKLDGMRPGHDFPDLFEQLQMNTSEIKGPVTQIKLHN